MPHNKIRAATRWRMAETGEPYAAARRAVIREHNSADGHVPLPGVQRFTISYSGTWSGRLTASLDRLFFRAGRGVAAVEMDAAEIRVRMGSFSLDIPRTSVRSVRRSLAKVDGTAGVHASRGRWLVNGSAEGLAEVVIDPPCHVAPGIVTLFGLGPSRVSQLIVSLDDPDGFIAAAEADANVL